MRLTQFFIIYIFVKKVICTGMKGGIRSRTPGAEIWDYSLSCKSRTPCLIKTKKVKNNRVTSNQLCWSTQLEKRAYVMNAQKDLLNVFLSKYSARNICMKSARLRSFSGPYIPTFGLNTERYSVSFGIHSECGKIRTRKIPKTTLITTLITHVSYRRCNVYCMIHFI